MSKLADEQRKEGEYNKLFEAVISKSPFSQWYPLMVSTSDMLTNNLQKRVGIDEDGRPLVVYKSEAGKLLGTWATATHKVIAKDLSQKEYGKALGALLGVGQVNEMIRQKRAKFFDISPKEVEEVYNKRVVLKGKNNRTTDDVKAQVVNDEKISYAPIIFFSFVGLVVVVGLIRLSK